MSDRDRRWMKPLLIALAIGYAAGKIVYELTGLIGLDSGAFGMLRDFFIPIAMVVALLAVLYMHDRSDD